MSLITLTYVFSPGNTIISSQHNTNNSTIYNDYNGNVTDVNIAANAAIEYTKLSLSGTLKGTDVSSANTANSIVVLNGSGKLAAIDGSLLTNVVASTNANLSGNQLGTWTSKSSGTIYQAATDGFAMAYASQTNGTDLYIMTDSSATPSTIRSRYTAITANSGQFGVSSVFTPVRKSDYWEVIVMGTTATVYWIPMGS